MTEWMLDYAADYGDLRIDVSRHKEAFRRFKELGMSQDGVRSTLAAREMVVFVFPKARFRVGVAGDLAEQEKVEAELASVGFASLFASHDPGEVDRIRAEVWGYFKRHFPGRCLEMAGSEGAADDARFVTISFFVPEVSGGDN